MNVGKKEEGKLGFAAEVKAELLKQQEGEVALVNC
jgi:hypothetical protein